MSSLSSSLTRNTTLSSLNVDFNSRITKLGKQAFLDKINSLRGLKRFRCDRATRIHNRDVDFAKRLARGLEKNFVLQEISYMKDLEDSDRWYLELNRRGRYLLFVDDLPIGIWPLVLSRMTMDSDNVKFLHYFVCRKVELLVQQWVVGRQANVTPLRKKQKR